MMPVNLNLMYVLHVWKTINRKGDKQWFEIYFILTPLSYCITAYYFNNNINKCYFQKLEKVVLPWKWKSILVLPSELNSRHFTEIACRKNLPIKTTSTGAASTDESYVLLHQLLRMKLFKKCIFSIIFFKLSLFFLKILPPW